MARKRNKNKRARTVSERQDYRQGGRVKKFTGGSPIRSGQMSRFRNLAREGQAELEELQRANKSILAPTPAPTPEPSQPPRTPGYTPPSSTPAPQPIMRPDIVRPGTKTGRPDVGACLLYTSPSPRDGLLSRMPSSA